MGSKGFQVAAWIAAGGAMFAWYKFKGGREGERMSQDDIAEWNLARKATISKRKNEKAQQS